MFVEHAPARASEAADPYGNSSSYQKNNSASAAAAGAPRRHRLIDDLKEAAEAAGIVGCSAEERAAALSQLREVGIDGRQCEHITACVPLAYIRANIAHVRRAVRDPKGGAYFKGLCQDWAGWLARHAAAYRSRTVARVGELDALSDADFSRLAHEAIDALDDGAQRDRLRVAVARHGTPRTSAALCDLILRYLDVLALSAAAAA